MITLLLDLINKVTHELVLLCVDTWSERKLQFISQKSVPSVGRTLEISKAFVWKNIYIFINSSQIEAKILMESLPSLDIYFRKSN